MVNNAAPFIKKSHLKMNPHLFEIGKIETGAEIYHGRSRKQQQPQKITA